MRRLGLRTRVTAIFAGGALVLSASMAMLSYGFIRSSLLNERERTATRTTYFDASVAQAGLVGSGADVPGVLGALNTGPVRRPVVYRDGAPYARSADIVTDTEIPLALRHLVESGQPGVQRVRNAHGTALIFGIPLSSDTQFYEIHSLEELDQTLRVIALILALVAAGTTVAGAALGWYTTRRVLRPLASVAQAAQGIAGGDLTARLETPPSPSSSSSPHRSTTWWTSWPDASNATAGSQPTSAMSCGRRCRRCQRQRQCWSTDLTVWTPGPRRRQNSSPRRWRVFNVS